MARRGWLAMRNKHAGSQTPICEPLPWKLQPPERLTVSECLPN